MPREMESNRSLPDLNSQCFMTGWLQNESLGHVNVTITDSKRCVEKFNSSHSDLLCAETKVILRYFFEYQLFTIHYITIF